jgi:hypothetical protein
MTVARAVQNDRDPWLFDSRERPKARATEAPRQTPPTPSPPPPPPPPPAVPRVVLLSHPKTSSPDLVRLVLVGPACLPQFAQLQFHTLTHPDRC